MHFLLSAMIEARRITEIGELVAELDAMNSGYGESSLRTISRRFARGALLTSRLLQDGVLEQDKRIRELDASHR
jgi:hypothetical protein